MAPFNEGTRRLAQYRPFDQGGQGLREVLGDLALAALALNGGGFGSLAECRDAFMTLWGLEVELDEWRAVAETLVTTGLADPGHRGIQLTATTLNGLEDTSKASTETEHEALADWEADVRQLRSDLTADDFECLREDL